MSVYSTEQWRRDRKHYLSTHPTCMDCGAPATTIDHVPPRRILIAAGIHNPDHPRWWQPLCESCHDRKTATIDRPLIERLRNGHDANELAEHAMRINASGIV